MTRPVDFDQTPNGGNRVNRLQLFGDQLFLAIQTALIQKARRLCRSVAIAKRRLRASRALRIRIIPPSPASALSTTGAAVASPQPVA